MHFSKESTINDGNCIYGDRETGLGGGWTGVKRKLHNIFHH